MQLQARECVRVCVCAYICVCVCVKNISDSCLNDNNNNNNYISLNKIYYLCFAQDRIFASLKFFFLFLLLFVVVSAKLCNI